MVREIARTQDGSVTLLSVLTLIDGEPRHRYQLRGGPHDGREFRSLAEVTTYAAVQGLQLTSAD